MIRPGCQTRFESLQGDSEDEAPGLRRDWEGAANLQKVRPLSTLHSVYTLFEQTRSESRLFDSLRVKVHPVHYDIVPAQQRSPDHLLT